MDTVIARLCLILDRDIRPGETLIILDGIQECPRARASLKSFSNDGRYDVIAIGTYPGVEDSHLFKMECRRRGELPPLLPMGYEEHIDMHGLDFEEFLWALGWNEDTTRDIRGHIARREPFGDAVLEDLLSRFGEFMTVGGMPGCVDRYLVHRNISDAHGVMAGIVDMVHDDIRRYDNGRIGARTWACLRSVTYQLTRDDGKFVLSHIDGGSASFGRYAESLVWIWSSGVGNFCMGAGKLEKPLEAFLDLRSFRLYLSDTGVLTYLFGRDDDLVRRAVLRNVVAECMMKCGTEPRFHRRGGIDIDFVTELGCDLTAILIGAERCVGHLRTDRTIVLGDGDIRTDGDGTEHFPLFCAAFMNELIDEEYRGKLNGTEPWFEPADDSIFYQT